jgi:hypothetical protein
MHARDLRHRCYKTTRLLVVIRMRGIEVTYEIGQGPVVRDSDFFQL